MFIDKLQIVLKSLLTCKIHKSALEYSIIRRYTNVVYYYYYYFVAIINLEDQYISLSMDALQFGHVHVQLTEPSYFLRQLIIIVIVLLALDASKSYDCI